MSRISAKEPEHPFLDTPIPVAEQRWDKTIRPYVSVSCITYNHEAVIKDALDGFLMQQTTFKIEVLIHDDASTDNTANIVKEYEEQYPDVFKVIYQTENQYSKKVKIGYTYQYPRVLGKYYAPCEGDDYWTDPLKLQKQLELLESNPNLVACFTNATYVNQLDHTTDIYVKGLPEGIVPSSKLIEAGGSIYPTASILARREFLMDRTGIHIPEMAGDELLLFNLLNQGDIYFLNQETCVYRRWSGGVFSSIINDYDRLVHYKIKDIVAYKKFDQYTQGKYSDLLDHKISKNASFIIQRGRGLNRFKYVKALKMQDLYRTAVNLLR